jgi:hypothetical protein
VNLWERLAARAIRASTLIDRAYRRFDRLRSRAVVAVGSEGLLNAYNDVAYGHTPEYRADLPKFRRELFRWERDVVTRWFPPAPARVVIGGAGGGREAFALAAQGYRIVAFEPSVALARSLAGAAPAGVETYLGRYERLPIVEGIATGERVNLRDGPPFGAAVFGWTSYSHLRAEAQRVRALQEVAALCEGPVLISFYPARHQPRRELFSVAVGFYHLCDEAEIRQTAAAAGVNVLELSMEDMDGRWPYAVLQRRGTRSG